MPPDRLHYCPTEHVLRIINKLVVVAVLCNQRCKFSLSATPSESSLCIFSFPCHRQVFTNTAAALPCELAPDDEAAAAAAAARKSSSSRAPLDWLPASKYQLAWAQRVFNTKQRQQQGPASGASA